MDQNSELHDIIKGIKRQFMAYRNGIIADSLRSAGYPYSIIFGLNVPQLAHISRTLTATPELAAALWADTEVRESRLLACYLFPHDMAQPDAEAFIESLRTPEEGDMLAFRLLKHLPYASSLVEKYATSDNAMQRHLADILAKHLS
jgi:3-methyladenine DNA glycosylase AlkD